MIGVGELFSHYLIGFNREKILDLPNPCQIGPFILTLILFDMSVFFVNSAPEEDVDSPAAIGDGNGNSSSGSADDSNPCDTVQYLDLTLKSFWPKITEEIRNIRVFDVRNQALPLARIKKIMKLDEDVKMISAEAPLLFSKAAEFFIMELTLRAWVHTEDNKRRTLQRSDIAMAINKYEQFDFLIDIVPREEAKVSLSRSQDCSRTAVNSDQIQYYYHLAQQQSESQPSAVQSVATTTATAAPATIVIQAPNSGQISTVTLASQPQEQHSNVSSNNTSTVNSCTTGNGGQIIQIPNTSATSSTGQIIQIPSNSSVDSGQIIQIQNNSQPNGSSTNNGNQVQFFQQVVTPNGDVQHIPIVVLPVQQQQQQRRK